MHRLFGKPKPKEPTPSLGDATTSINNRVKALDEKILGLDSELIKFKDQLKKAKGPAADNIKRRALETLKRKKMYEAQRDQMAGQAFNVEQTSFAIESIRDTQTTIFAMKAAATQLKTEAKKIDLGEVEDMQDDLADLFEDMTEINDIMGRSYGTPEGLDDDDLEAELAALGDELEGLEELGVDEPQVGVQPPAAAATATDLPMMPTLPTPTPQQPQTMTANGATATATPVQSSTYL